MKKLLYFLTIAFINTACFQEDLFSQLKTAETGIDFSNRITENDTTNILSYEYVYNGGGVALGDFNNDSLTDVYFTANTAKNKLFLNQGNFKFKNVTEQAGVDGEGRWSSGVAMVDINNDKLLDLYVCATAKKPASQRANLLYVNQGIGKDGVPIFKEMAKEYGVADTTHSINAAFFDYDNDGDLDLYVLVNEMDDIRFPNKYHDKIRDGSSKRTDKLYRNDWSEEKKHPVYTDVSKQAGILIEGYGLGLNICDMNQDGWKDIYVTNDYLTNDLLYINNKNGTFTDEAHHYFKHTSYSAMGNDVNDINNDGLVDVVALDMMPANNERKKMVMGSSSYINYQNNEAYGYDYQYSRNTFQLNMGKNKDGRAIFSEIGLLAGVAETDWSWTPLLTDFDNDGFRDLIVTNGFPRDVTDQDFIAYRQETERLTTRDMLLQLIPSVKIPNVAFRNKGGFEFENVSEKWGIHEPSFSNGAAYADLDNDGDLDYIVNNINDSAFVYRNNLVQQKPEESNYLRIKFKGGEQNIMGFGARVEIKMPDGSLQVHDNTPYRGYLSSLEPIAHFGFGKETIVPEIKIIWQNGKMQVLKNQKTNRTIVVDIAQAQQNYLPKTEQNGVFQDITDSLKIDFTHQEQDYIDFNIQKLLPHKFSQSGPCLATGDVNGDGKDDIFVGASIYRSGEFFLSTKSGFERKYLEVLKDTLQKEAEETGAVFVDVDKDKDLDLFLVSGGYEASTNYKSYQDRLFLNDGKGNFSPQALPKETESGSCVRAADFDKDGDVDLFVAGKVSVWEYPKPATSLLYINESKNGKVAFRLQRFEKIGMVNDARFADMDKDGWQDLVLAGELMPLTILKNSQGKFSKENKTEIPNSSGMWYSLNTADLDKDGDKDFVAGNLGLNSFLRASEKEPVSVFGKDFNNDNSYDALPFVYFDTNKGRKQVPLNGRDDFIKQIVQTRGKFTDFKSFAETDAKTFFKPEEKEGMLELRATEMHSCWVENLGNDKYKLHYLPQQAQFAPITASLIADYNADGYMDILAVGNDFGAELQTGRYDAHNGIFLKGSKTGFTFIPPSKSGFYVAGDAKFLQVFDKNKFVVTQNKGKLKIFR